MTNIKCLLCKLSKPETEYNFFRGMLNKTCKKCRVKNNLWYSNDKDNRKTKAKIYYQKVKNRISNYRSDLRLDRKYSLTREKWNEMLKSQNNKCMICETYLYKPCVDHDHKTGKVRGLLCRNCNLNLQVVEDIEFVKKANIYLKSMM